MGLCYETSRWLDRLWAEHLEISTSARDLALAGIQKQGEHFAGFPADLHARLYLPRDPRVLDSAPPWAMRLHEEASQLGEWGRLRVVCARNGFAAAIAAETMLEKLLPHVPERPECPSIPAGASHEPPSGQSPGCAPPGNRPAGPRDVPGESEREGDLSNADLRAALRRAARAAQDAVRVAESQLEGLGTPLGFSSSGSATVQNAGRANMKDIRDAYAHLSSSRRLQRIAQLAGRLERVAASKAKSKVRPGVGEVHGVGRGGDLARLLPSELASLRHPRLRLLGLARLLQRQTLVYGMTGREPQARGPIVALLDESASMRELSKDIWSKAACLALLSTATRQKRAWHLVAFNGHIVREVAIPAGKATALDIQNALDHGCAGGTDFNKPVTRATQVINSSRAMHAADVVIITDGKARLESDTIEAATALTRTEGVSWYVVAITPDVDTCAKSLGPIATSVVWLRDLDDPEPIVPIINLDRSSP